MPFAVIARTGFFVLCSVFKEHRPDSVGPEEAGRSRPSQNSEVMQPDEESTGYSRFQWGLLEEGRFRSGLPPYRASHKHATRRVAVRLLPAELLPWRLPTGGSPELGTAGAGGGVKLDHV